MVDETGDFESAAMDVADDGFSRTVMVRIRSVRRRRYAVLACATVAGVMLALPGMVEVTTWVGAVGSALPAVASHLATLEAAVPLAIYAALATVWVLANAVD